MGIGSIGIPSLILIIIVALIIFGPKKLPEIGKAAGQTLQEFKQSTSGLTGDDEEEHTADTDDQSDEGTLRKE